MTLAPGVRLGPYEVVSLLGAGGMGEVYQAKDTRLDRLVALKILPDALAGDPQFRDRLDREARTISQLSHPHICRLFDVGHQDGVHFLVMEFLDGETLADRLARGGPERPALQLAETLRIAAEIAGALDAAHRQGIVHRDLKPGNVMLTKAGSKLLDFGLAKTGGPIVAGASGTMAATTPPNLTAQGTILGTIQYMAPEQIEGQDADARTDIFAFGVCLYEMTTGRKAFQGKTYASVMGSILKDEPPRVSTLQPVSPPALDRVVETCLAKNPDDRFQTAHDLLLQLRWIAEGGSAVGIPAPVAARRRNRERIAWASAAVLALALAGASYVAISHLREEPSPTVRFVALPPENVASLDAAAISPDGRRLVFVAVQDSGPKLWMRPIDSLSAQVLQGTDGASYPFWSPDSQFVAFFAGGKLKKVPVGGGPPQTLTDAPNARSTGSWNQDGVILFSPDTTAPIYRVSAAGGTSTPATRLDANGVGHRFPFFLPDNRHFVYARGVPALGGVLDILVASLDAPQGVPLLKADSNAIYAPPGYLLFSREKTLLAQPFDAARIRLTGEAFPVAEHVEPNGFGFAVFGASTTGTLMYQPGSNRFDLTWFDRTGRSLEVLHTPEPSDDFDLAADEKQLAVTGKGTAAGTDIWLVDLARKSSARFTFDEGGHAFETWSPDASRVAYTVAAGGKSVIAVKDTSGALAPVEIARPPVGPAILVWDWTKDGRYLVCGLVDPKTALDLWALPMDGDRKPFPLVQMSGVQVHGQVSADGRWLAYSSNESGNFDVYVQDFPTPRRRWKVSTNGGVQPHWRRDGREMFYLAVDGKLMAVPIETSSTFSPGVPVPLFQTRTPGGPFTVARRHFQPSADGQRFLVKNVAADAIATSYVLVLNWTSGIRR